MNALRFPTRLLLVALALGICADQLFYGRALGVSAPLFVALGLAGLASLSAAEERKPTRANMWLGASALFFALCVAWRTTPALTVFNMLAVFGLLLLLAANYRGVALERLPYARALAQLFVAPIEMAVRPMPLLVKSASQIQIDHAQARRLMPVGRGLVLATPVLLVFTVLLMAADSVFASYVTRVFSLELPFDLTTLIGHLMLVLFFAWICAGGLVIALISDSNSAFGSAIEKLFGSLIGLVYAAPARADGELPAEGATQLLSEPKRPLLAIGWVEALTVLVSVNLLFGCFMLIQGAYFFGGLDTLARTGMTYSEYARRGFFELLAVACLALVMLCSLAIATRREAGRQRRGFNAASAALIALVLGLLASAYYRMFLYEQAYGYTELRLYTHSFMIWLAVVLGLFLLALLREKPRLFAIGGLISALVYLAVLNIANPDALIVRANIARYQVSGKIDADYLAWLSPDATPTLVAALGTLNDNARDMIVPALEVRHEQLAQTAISAGWPGWQLGRARALATLEQAGIGRRVMMDE